MATHSTESRTDTGLSEASARDYAFPRSRKDLPHLTGIRLRQIADLIALRLAPAVAAGAIAMTRLDSFWLALLLTVCVLVAASVLRRPQYPMHLIPFASAIVYLLTPLLGAGLALAITALDGYSAGNITVGELVPAILGAWIVTAFGILVSRRLRRERMLRVAVIGSHEFARGFQAELEALGIKEYEVVGCIDPETSCPTDTVAGVRCLGSLVLLRRTVLAEGLELLALGPLSPSPETAGQYMPADETFQGPRVSRLQVFETAADACLDLPVSLIEAGQFYEQLFGHVPLGTTTAAWFQYLLHPEYKQSWSVSKRLLDLGVGLLAAIIAAPVLLISALAIKVSDGGPVFFRQTRLGEEGREIEMLKLRTMDPDPDADSTGANGSGGHRVTPVGRVLRRLHINELPQIWLVLKGEMSLVGPRPEIPEMVLALESRFTYYDRRHLLKPGITGWASVRCGYSGTPVGEAWKLCHDLYYLKRRSLLFDVLIMMETLSTVFLPEPINRPDERFIVAAQTGEEVESGLRTPA